MGLDQYAKASAYTMEQISAMHKAEQRVEMEEIMYWRKHNRLQGWMEDLWRARGGEGDFNLEYLELDADDIDNLRSAVLNGDLPETRGFFFGTDSYEADWRNELEAQDLEFCDKANQCFEQGLHVYYFCWW